MGVGPPLACPSTVVAVSEVHSAVPSMPGMSAVPLTERDGGNRMRERA